MVLGGMLDLVGWFVFFSLFVLFVLLWGFSGFFKCFYGTLNTIHKYIN